MEAVSPDGAMDRQGTCRHEQRQEQTPSPGAGPMEWAQERSEARAPFPEGPHSALCRRPSITAHPLQTPPPQPPYRDSPCTARPEHSLIALRRAAPPWGLRHCDPPPLWHCGAWAPGGNLRGCGGCTVDGLRTRICSRDEACRSIYRCALKSAECMCVSF
uniref:Uncharacterized protein n=1 Tax=Eutreptiella gymnastica TaxID=73025 RepID=A0A7S4FWF8_9EUGL